MRFAIETLSPRLFLFRTMSFGFCATFTEIANKMARARQQTGFRLLSLLIVTIPLLFNRRKLLLATSVANKSHKFKRSNKVAK